jgi:hypothetical protein
VTWQPLRRTTKQALVSEEGPAIGPQDPSLRGDPLISSVMTANALSLVASWPKLLAGDSDQSPASLDWITLCWVAVLVSYALTAERDLDKALLAGVGRSSGIWSCGVKNRLSKAGSASNCTDWHISLCRRVEWGWCHAEGKRVGVVI